MKMLLLVFLSVFVLGRSQTHKQPQDFTAIVNEYTVFELVECKDTIWREDNTFWINEFPCDSLVERKKIFYDITFDFHSNRFSFGNIDNRITYNDIDTSYWAIEYTGCCDESSMVDSDCELYVNSDLGVWLIDYCKETIYLQYGQTTTTYKLSEFIKY